MIGARTIPRILLVDEHPAVRQGLALVLEAAGVGDCREAGGREEALDVAGREAPELALVGLSMEREETITLVRELRALRIAVLVFSEEEGPAQVQRAMAAGARGYVAKGDTQLGIVRAVRDVLAGWILISPGAAVGLDDAGWPLEARKSSLEKPSTR